jgi:hypothetical protein
MNIALKNASVLLKCGVDVVAVEANTGVIWYEDAIENHTLISVLPLSIRDKEYVQT